MRLPIIAITIAVLINILLDTLIYRRLKKKPLKIAQAVLTVILTLIIVTAVALPRRTISNDGLLDIMWMLYWYFTFYIPKYIYLIIYGIASIPMLFKAKPLRWLDYVGAVLAVTLLASMIWGGLVGRLQTEVKPVDVTSAKVPKAFDGYRIVQLSDIHIGSYGTDTTFMAKVVDEINALHPDLVLFTGDIVNRESAELKPFTSTLARLHAKDGIYSVLGNHDYADYKNWDSDAEKVADVQNLVKMENEMGWRMLNNESRVIKHGTDSIIIIGVENIGDPPFPVYGDLSTAYPNANDSNFKILLSHNPIHWKKEVLPHTNIDLMLAGHTHAMQMEFDIFGLRFSPSVFRYKEWGGMYEQGEQKLYVNIGLGTVGYPARIGAATPEITLITLQNYDR